MAQPTKQDFEDYKRELEKYITVELVPYIDAYDDSGTNPPAPLPPKPPHVIEE